MNIKQRARVAPENSGAQPEDRVPLLKKLMKMLQYLI